MATLSISWTVPDTQAARIKDDFAAFFGWTATIPDPNNPQQTIPNPESQNAFIKRVLGNYIKTSIQTRREQVGRLASDTSVKTDVDTNVLLT